MMQAAHSWWQSTKGSPRARAASRTSRLDPPPGTPKRRATSARSRPSTRRSATVGITRLRRWRARTAPPPRPLAPRQAPEHRLHALERLLEVGLRAGIGEAQVALAVLA